jgi:hypothetical protein
MQRKWLFVTFVFYSSFDLKVFHSDQGVEKLFYLQNIHYKQYFSLWDTTHTNYEMAVIRPYIVTSRCRFPEVQPQFAFVCRRIQ